MTEVMRAADVGRYAVSQAIRHLEADGYAIRSVEHVGLRGGDLEATRDGRTVLVEVKGTQGDRSSVALRPSQMQRATECGDADGWVLIVVYRIGNPEVGGHLLERFSARRVIDGSALRPAWREDPATWILTWNPARFDWEGVGGLAKDIAAVERGRFEGGWSCGRSTRLLPGDMFYLHMQGARGRGLVARGRVTSEVYEQPHWRNVGKTAQYVDIEPERILLPRRRLDVADLRAQVPAVRWQHLYSSGNRVSSEASQQLNRAWSDHLAAL